MGPKSFILESPVYEVVRVKKRTSAKGFDKLSPGDRIRLSLTLERTSGASGNGQYATYVKMESLNKKINVSKSQTQILWFLSFFDLRELHPGDV